MLKRHQRNQNNIDNMHPVSSLDSIDGENCKEDGNSSSIQDNNVNVIEEADVYEERDDESNLSEYISEVKISHVEDQCVSLIANHEDSKIESPESSTDQEDEIGLEMDVSRLKKTLIVSYLKQISSISEEAKRRRRHLRAQAQVQASSSSHEKLMKIVRDERSKHREMINRLENTTFEISRKPLTTKKCKYLQDAQIKYSYSLFHQANNIVRKKLQAYNTSSAEKDTQKESKSRSVHFGTMVTFDDHSTPVPIRPPRKKSAKKLLSFKPVPRPRARAWVARSGSASSQLQLARRKMEVKEFQSPDEDKPGPPPAPAPAKPSRVYRGRGGTPLSRALAPLAGHRYQEAETTINQMIEVCKHKSPNSRSRSTLSSLNLLRSLVDEKLKLMVPCNFGRTVTDLGCRKT